MNDNFAFQAHLSDTYFAVPHKTMRGANNIYATQTDCPSSVAVDGRTYCDKSTTTATYSTKMQTNCSVRLQVSAHTD